MSSPSTSTVAWAVILSVLGGMGVVFLVAYAYAAQRWKGTDRPYRSAEGHVRRRRRARVENSDMDTNTDDQQQQQTSRVRKRVEDFTPPPSSRAPTLPLPGREKQVRREQTAPVMLRHDTVRVRGEDEEVAVSYLAMDRLMGREQCEESFFKLKRARADRIGKGSYGSVYPVCIEDADRDGAETCSFVVKVMEYDIQHSSEQDVYGHEVYFLELLRSKFEEQWQLYWRRRDEGEAPRFWQQEEESLRAPKAIDQFYYKNRVTGVVQEEMPDAQIAPFIFDWWVCRPSVDVDMVATRRQVFIVMQRFDGDVHDLLSELRYRDPADVDALVARTFLLGQRLADEYNIVHGDLKTDNYLYRRRYNRASRRIEYDVVVTDYSFAGDYKRFAPRYGWRPGPPGEQVVLPDEEWVRRHFNALQLLSFYRTVDTETPFPYYLNVSPVVRTLDRKSFEQFEALNQRIRFEPSATEQLFVEAPIKRKQEEISRTRGVGQVYKRLVQALNEEEDSDDLKFPAAKRKVLVSSKRKKLLRYEGRELQVSYLALDHQMGRRECEQTLFDLKRDHLLGKGMYGEVYPVCTAPDECGFVVKVIEYEEGEFDYPDQAYEHEVYTLTKLKERVDRDWIVTWRDSKFYYEHRRSALIQTTIPDSQIAPYLFDWWLCPSTPEEESSNSDTRVGVTTVFLVMQRFDGNADELWARVHDFSNVKASNELLARAFEVAQRFSGEFGFVHGDMKMNNFLYKREEEEEKYALVLTDFGFAGDFERYTPMFGTRLNATIPVYLPAEEWVREDFNVLQLYHVITKMTMMWFDRRELVAISPGVLGHVPKEHFTAFAKLVARANRTRDNDFILLGDDMDPQRALATLPDFKPAEAPVKRKGISSSPGDEDIPLEKRVKTESVFDRSLRVLFDVWTEYGTFDYGSLPNDAERARLYEAQIHILEDEFPDEADTIRKWLPSSSGSSGELVSFSDAVATSSSDYAWLYSVDMSRWNPDYPGRNFGYECHFLLPSRRDLDVFRDEIADAFDNADVRSGTFMPVFLHNGGRTLPLFRRVNNWFQIDRQREELERHLVHDFTVVMQNHPVADNEFEAFRMSISVKRVFIDDNDEPLGIDELEVHVFIETQLPLIPVKTTEPNGYVNGSVFFLPVFGNEKDYYRWFYPLRDEVFDENSITTDDIDEWVVQEKDAALRAAEERERAFQPKIARVLEYMSRVRAAWAGEGVSDNGKVARNVAAWRVVQEMLNDVLERDAFSHVIHIDDEERLRTVKPWSITDTIQEQLRASQSAPERWEFPAQSKEGVVYWNIFSRSDGGLSPYEFVRERTGYTPIEIDTAAVKKRFDTELSQLQKETAHPRIWNRDAKYVAAAFLGPVDLSSLVIPELFHSSRTLSEDASDYDYVSKQIATMGARRILIFENDFWASVKRWNPEKLDVPRHVALYVIEYITDNPVGTQMLFQNAFFKIAHLMNFNDSEAEEIVKFIGRGVKSFRDTLDQQQRDTMLTGFTLTNVDFGGYSGSGGVNEQRRRHYIDYIMINGSLGEPSTTIALPELSLASSDAELKMAAQHYYERRARLEAGKREFMAAYDAMASGKLTREEVWAQWSEMLLIVQQVFYQRDSGVYELEVETPLISDKSLWMFDLICKGSELNAFTAQDFNTLLEELSFFDTDDVSAGGSGRKTFADRYVAKETGLAVFWRIASKANSEDSIRNSVHEFMANSYLAKSENTFYATPLRLDMDVSDEMREEQDELNMFAVIVQPSPQLAVRRVVEWTVSGYEAKYHAIEQQLVQVNIMLWVQSGEGREHLARVRDRVQQEIDAISFSANARPLPANKSPDYNEVFNAVSKTFMRIFNENYEKTQLLIESLFDLDVKVYRQRIAMDEVNNFHRGIHKRAVVETNAAPLSQSFVPNNSVRLLNSWFRGTLSNNSHYTDEQQDANADLSEMVVDARKTMKARQGIEFRSFEAYAHSMEPKQVVYYWRKYQQPFFRKNHELLKFMAGAVFLEEDGFRRWSTVYELFNNLYRTHRQARQGTVLTEYNDEGGYAFTPFMELTTDEERLAFLKRRYPDQPRQLYASSHQVLYHGGKIDRLENGECCFFVTDDEKMAKSFIDDDEKLWLIYMKPGRHIGPFYGPLSFYDARRFGSGISLPKLLLQAWERMPEAKLRENYDTIVNSARHAAIIPSRLVTQIEERGDGEFPDSLFFYLDLSSVVPGSDVMGKALMPFIKHSSDEAVRFRTYISGSGLSSRFEGVFNSVLARMGVSRYNVRGKELMSQDTTSSPYVTYREPEYLLVPSMYRTVQHSDVPIASAEAFDAFLAAPKEAREFTEEYLRIFNHDWTEGERFEQAARFLYNRDAGQITGLPIEFVPEREQWRTLFERTQHGDSDARDALIESLRDHEDSAADQVLYFRNATTGESMAFDASRVGEYYGFADDDYILSQFTLDTMLERDTVLERATAVVERMEDEDADPTKYEEESFAREVLLTRLNRIMTRDEYEASTAKQNAEAGFSRMMRALGFQ